jgi:hypothetical protein
MNESEQIESAKAYVALSNAHRLEFILPMFADGATYHSPHVGEFIGRNAIGEMMADFFSRFPDVRWNALEYRCTEKGVVRFKFEMFATEALTGKSVERRGTERIEFTDEGHISRLEVKSQ